MMYILKLAIRSLFFRRRQYTSLFLVCAFGVAISLFSVFLISGMLSSLSTKAKIYYGGDLQIMRDDWGMNFWDVEAEIENFKDIFPTDCVVSPRYDLDAATSSYFYEGVGVRQRVIKGVDFNREEELFKQFNFVQGDFSGISGTNGVLISQPIAEMLTVNAGDDITFMLYDCHGYLNTVQLRVKGIFKDSSLFGMYTSYMDIDMLRTAYGMTGSKYANRIAISFNGKEPSAKEVNSYFDSLSKKVNTYPMVKDKNIYYNAAAQTNDVLYALIPLSANLQEVQILIDAMKGITGFIIVMLIVIIVVGISSTYKILVMKRINEIGIHMAIGTKKWQIHLSLLMETFFLLVLGCIAGFVFSQILCLVARNLSLSFIPAFDIFLVNGYLNPVTSLLFSCNLIFIILLFTLIAVARAVHKSVNIMPVQALAVTE